MLRTIRGKFAASLLLLLALGAALTFFFATNVAGTVLIPGELAIMSGALIALFVLLVVERVVINPLLRVTRDIVSVSEGDPLDPKNRLVEAGSHEVATLARTFNKLMEHLAERQRLEAQLVHMAHHDPLTGLPNRLVFRKQLDVELARARRGQNLAVVCLDLDHFKSVNDTLGHPIGDALLKTVADRLRNCLRDTDTVARLGGDEFAVLQVGTKQPEGATALSERLIDAIAAPFDLDGHQVVVGTSIGVALTPSDGLESNQLMRAADMALYRAKADGRGTYRFFEPEMDAKMQARRALELDLRRALVTGEFEVFYQPVVNLRDNQVSGLEALLRWNHPTRGLVNPSEFIPLAEEIGLIVPLGEWALRQACADAARWPARIKVAVNLSPAQFKSKTLVRTVRSALADSGLPPQRLELEITESVLLQETEGTLATLHELRALGILISMDDFGTGYSSLSYLRSFPFDKIKIDQSFVRDLSRKEGSTAIVRAVAGLGQNLGMATTAEGVETVEQLGYLREAGCTEVQGFLFSRAIPSDDVLSMLNEIHEKLQAATDVAVLENIRTHIRPRRVFRGTGTTGG